MGVLLFHGLTACPSELKELAQKLNKKGLTVRAPLLPGHGTHPKNLRETAWQDWFQEAKKNLFEMRKKCKKIIVGGLSTGASLAMHLSAHYQVEGVIALSPGIFLKSKMIKLLPILRPFLRYYRKKNGPDISDAEARRNSLGYNKIPIKSILEAQKLYKHLQEDLADIYIPLFIAQSLNDHVVCFEGAEYIYHNVSSLNKRLLRLEKSYHVITLDVEKDIVTREVLKFVETILK